MNQDKSDLIIISGLPGTGKTTYGRYIAERFKLTYVDYDTVIQIFMDGIYESFYQGVPYNEFRAEWRACTYESFWSVVADNLKLGNTVAASAPLSKEQCEKEFFTELRRKYGIKGRILSIIMDLPEEMLYERILNRGEERDREKLAQWKQYYKSQRHPVIWNPDRQVFFQPGQEKELYIKVREFLAENFNQENDTKEE